MTETFAFDPPGNILAVDATLESLPPSRRPPLPQVLDILLKEYAGTHYRYDEREQSAFGLRPPAEAPQSYKTFKS